MTTLPTAPALPNIVPVSPIGTIRADNTDPNSRAAIAQGAIIGDGLLGRLAEAIVLLDSRAQEYGYSSRDENLALLQAVRIAVFDALKAIEAAQ